MLGTFTFITIPGNCTHVHKILFLERNKQFDNKILKINGVRTTSYDVLFFNITIQLVEIMMTPLGIQLLSSPE